MSVVIIRVYAAHIIISLNVFANLLFFVGIYYMSTNQFIATMLLALIPGLTFLAFSFFSKDLEKNKNKALWTITIVMVLTLLAIKQWIP